MPIGCCTFVTALTLFWELRGHLPEGQRWFARALAASPEPSIARARALWGAAHVALYDDDFDGSAELAAAALEVAEQTGDAWAKARALNTVGYGAVWTDPTETRAGDSRRASSSVARSATTGRSRTA